MEWAIHLFKYPKISKYYRKKLGSMDLADRALVEFVEM